MSDLASALTSIPSLSFDEAVGLMKRATSAGDLDASARRRLFRVLHPDVVPADRREEAEAATARLTELLAGPSKELTVSTRRHSFRIAVPALVSTDEINSYRCRWVATDGSGTTHDDDLLKVARVPEAGKLIAAEVAALKALDKSEDDPTKFRAYAPRLVDSFRWKMAGKGERQAEVLSYPVPSKDRISLTGVIEAYPNGLDPRDVAWMWRRLLAATTWWHRAGIVHDNLTTDNVLIVPELHGLIVTDWHNSASVDDRNNAMDIARGADLMLALMKDVPRPLQAFARGCQYTSDAAVALADFNEVIERLWGPRKFRPFSVPGMGG